MDRAGGAWERFTGPVERLTRLIPERDAGRLPPVLRDVPRVADVRGPGHERCWCGWRTTRVANSGRRVDWLHLAGPRYLRSEEDAVLTRLWPSLDPGDARVYLGIVLPVDGVAGLQRRKADRIARTWPTSAWRSTAGSAASEGGTSWRPCASTGTRPGRAGERAGSAGPTRMTSRVRGPCTPSTRDSSMSLVADGPLIQVSGRRRARGQPGDRLRDQLDHLLGPHHAQVIVGHQGDRAPALVGGGVQDDGAGLGDRDRGPGDHAVDGVQIRRRQPVVGHRPRFRAAGPPKGRAARPPAGRRAAVSAARDLGGQPVAAWSGGPRRGSRPGARRAGPAGARRSGSPGSGRRARPGGDGA